MLNPNKSYNPNDSATVSEHTEFLQKGVLGIMINQLPKLENILDNLDVGISIFDNKGTFLFVNRGVLDYTGRTRQDYQNQTVYDFMRKGIYADSAVDKVYQCKRVVSKMHITVRPDGKLVDRLVVATPIFGSQGDIVYVISCQIDANDIAKKFKQAQAQKAVLLERKAFQGNRNCVQLCHEKRLGRRAPGQRKPTPASCCWGSLDAERRWPPIISTGTARERIGSWLPSTVRPYRLPCWKQSYLAMKRVLLPALLRRERWV